MARHKHTGTAPPTQTHWNIAADETVDGPLHRRLKFTTAATKKTPHHDGTANHELFQFASRPEVVRLPSTSVATAAAPVDERMCDLISMLMAMPHIVTFKHSCLGHWHMNCLLAVNLRLTSIP